MARRPRLFAPGLLYHVIVRGNQKQKTFLTDKDYQTYVDVLAKYRRKFDVTVHAYCLMPNHVHLLVQSSGEPLARFMQGLQQSYTQYFNRMHKKVGHLFQGRYKAIVCEKDEYLLTLIRYIHLNPVRAKLVREAKDCLWSGHGGYLKGKVNEVLDPREGLKLLGGSRNYQKFVSEGKEEGHREEYYEVEDQRFLGKEGFGEKLRKGAREEALRPVTKPLAQVIKELATASATKMEEVCGPDRGRKISQRRLIISYVLVRKAGYKVKDVAKSLGRDPTTLSVLMARLGERMSLESEIQEEVDRLSRIVNK
jgi:REP-associated tyrosine transposase